MYNNEVVVFGTPLLTLRVGDAPYYNRRAVYSSGSGTSALVFEYIVEVRLREFIRILHGWHNSACHRALSDIQPSFRCEKTIPLRLLPSLQPHAE